MAVTHLENSIHFDANGAMSDDRFVVISKASLFANGRAPYKGLPVFLNVNTAEAGLYLFKSVGTSWETSNVTKLLDADSLASQNSLIFNFAGTINSTLYPKLQLDTDTLNYYTTSESHTAVAVGDMFKVTEAMTIDVAHYAGVSGTSTVSLAEGTIVIITAIGTNWKLIDITVNLDGFVKKGDAPVNEGTSHLAAFDGQGNVFETSVTIQSLSALSQTPGAPAEHTHSINDIVEKPINAVHVTYGNCIIDAPIFQFEDLASLPASLQFVETDEEQLVIDHTDDYVVNFRKNGPQPDVDAGNAIFSTIDNTYLEDTTHSVLLIPNGDIYVITNSQISNEPVYQKEHLTHLGDNYYEGIITLSGNQYLLSLDLGIRPFDAIWCPLVNTSGDETALETELGDILSINKPHLSNIDFTWSSANKTIKYTLLRNKVIYTEYTSIDN